MHAADSAHLALMPATETRVTPPEIRLPARGGELRLAARPEMRLANPDGRHAADVVLPYLVLMQGLQYTRFGLVNMRVPSMCGIPVRRVSEGTGVLHQCSITSAACLSDGRHEADVVLPSPYRGTSLIRNSASLGPYRSIWWS